MSWRRDRDDGVGSRRAIPRRLAAASARGRAAVVSFSFWTAVLLPALLVGLLVTGIDTVTRAAAFLALAAVEVLALVVGRAYSPA